MGVYINPKDMTKEEWLKQNAVEVSMGTPYRDIPNGTAVIVFVENGDFTAAGVCYDEAEFNRFTDPIDPRPRKMFIAEKELIETVAG